LILFRIELKNDFCERGPVMAKLLGLFLTAAQIFDNRRKEIGQDRAVLTASIQIVPLPGAWEPHVASLFTGERRSAHFKLTGTELQFLQLRCPFTHPSTSVQGR
jgi:hypothetical protein